MGVTYVKEVMSPEELLEAYPLPAEHKKLKEARDAEIKKVFTGESDKFLVIIGPCSADNEDSVCDYINRLAKVQDKVSDKILIIPRIYTNKPRTTGQGYKGIVHQPDPEKEPDLHDGIIAMRKMHLRAIAETHLFAADEMLYPENWPYISDILSYVAVGARSVEDQQHRLTVSGFDIPCGMKNPTSGTLSIMLNSCIAAQSSHTFMYRQWEVKTDGNPLAHTILRGAVNKHDQSMPNYHYEDLVLLNEMYQELDMQTMQTPTSSILSSLVSFLRFFTAVTYPTTLRSLSRVLWWRATSSRAIRRFPNTSTVNQSQMPALAGMSLSD